jgi:hypothetical protein
LAVLGRFLGLNKIFLSKNSRRKKKHEYRITAKKALRQRFQQTATRER